MKPINPIAVSLFIWSFLQVAAAETSGNPNGNYSLECPLAEILATKSYDRAQAAWAASDENAAILYSKSFWDIYEFSRGCPFVKTLADRMNGFGFQESATVSQNKRTHNITMSTSSTGGSGNVSGMEPIENITLTSPKREIIIDNPRSTRQLTVPNQIQIQRNQ